MGVAIFIIGLGQLLAWVKVSPALAYSGVGLGLILYWSLPTREAGRLAELGRNPGDFFISGLFLVGGAILLFLYNAERLLSLFAGLLGRLGRLLPVARVSIAYPVAAKGRTATTLAMFSLIVFTLVGTATIANTFGGFLDIESGSGGYDVLVQANPFNPVAPELFSEQLDVLVAAGAMAAPAAVAGLGTLIGYVLALTFAYNLYLQVAADQGLPFLPPWPRLIGIAVSILGASLLVAWLHARQSAKVVIAEALRYQA